MAKALTNKLREVEDEHAETVVTEHLQQHDEMRRDQAHQLLGAARYADFQRKQCGSHILEFLMTAEDDNLYLEYGFQRFADFLDSDLSPISKSQFYKLKEVYLREGPTRYDLLTEWKIPLTTRKLLAAGDIEVDGNEVVIGGEERVQMGDSRQIKAVIERLVNDRKTATDDLAKAEQKAEELSVQIKTGTEEYNELLRNLDALKSGSPYDRAIGQAIHSLLVLQEAIGQLPDKEKPKKGKDAIPTLWTVLLRVRDSFGISIPLVETAALEDGDFQAKLAAALAEPDDLDLEEKE